MIDILYFLWYNTHPMTDLNSREKFIKMYANLPIPVRNEIIYIDENKNPVTWNVAYIEVNQNTPLGIAILKHLESLNVL